MKLLQLSLLFVICSLQAVDVEICEFNQETHGEAVKGLIVANEQSLILDDVQSADALYGLCLRDKSKPLVARLGATVIGFVNGLRLPGYVGNKYVLGKKIYSIAVEEGYRRRGYGRQLLMTFIGEERSVIAHAPTTNMRACSFYRVCGLRHSFELSAIRESVYHLDPTHEAWAASGLADMGAEPPEGMPRLQLG